MTHFDYQASKAIVAQDYPFYALIMAAMRQADTRNMTMLEEAWPEVADEAHECLTAAVVVHGDRKVWFRCRSHEGGKHHFAAHWPPCPAPWCRLPYSHYLEGTMHDIPAGTVEIHDAIGVRA